VSAAPRNRELWLDILCLRSALWLVFRARAHGIGRVRFLIATPAMRRIVAMIQRLAGASVEQVTDLDYGRNFIGEASVAETIEQKTRAGADALIAGWMGDPAIEAFIAGSGFDRELTCRHLGRMAWRYLLRPAELSTLADAFGESDSVLLLRRNPLVPALISILAGRDAHAYGAPLFRWRYEARPFHSLDADMTHMRTYCGGPLRQLARTLRYALEAALSGRHQPRPQPVPQPTIAVMRSIPFPFSFDELNDMYWWPDSGIDAGSVVIITQTIPLSDADRAEARRYGFRLLHLARPFGGNTGRRATDPDDDVIVAPGMGLAWAELKCAFRAGLHAWHSETVFSAWTGLHLATFEMYARNRARLFERLGVRIIWHMDDILGDGPFNHQAVKLCGGLSAGSHFSNHIYNVAEVEHLEDVVFPWGPFYADAFFNRHHHMDVVPAGFYLDYRFKPKPSSRPSALADKFVISFLDQGMYVDRYLSPDAHVAIWSALIGVLDAVPHAVLVWKPKRNSFVERLTARLSELARLIDSGRVITYQGKSDTVKSAPSSAGTVSDLAIAAMFSTAGLECWLAGTPTLFLDLSRQTREFVPAADRNRIVFDDLERLKSEIVRQASSDAPTTAALSPEFADTLDPFRDGQAYRRTGAYLRFLLEALDGADAPMATAAARSRYDAEIAASGARAVRAQN
jgi:hypothetical protein